MPNDGSSRVVRLCLAPSIAALIAAAAPATASPSTVHNPGVAPIHSHPHGSSYGAWATAWWKWALETPAAINPVLDHGPCDVGQQGHVWFLAGTFAGTGEAIVRTCDVPTGTSLLVPLISAFYGAFLNDPPETRTEEYIRAQVACSDVDIEVAEIDGVAIRDPEQYFVTSPELYGIQLPEDNVFGLGPDVIPELRLDPSADSGYYLFLNPLPPGTHTIRWIAHMTCPFGTFTQDTRYTITVTAGRMPG